MQRGGFASEQDARAALERALEKTRRTARVPTLVELVEQYLAQHGVAPATHEKLRWLLTHALAAFRARRINELETARDRRWRMTIKPVDRFEATQALRQVLARAVLWPCSTSTRPSKESRTRSGGGRRSDRSNRG